MGFFIFIFFKNMSLDMLGTLWKITTVKNHPPKQVREMAKKRGVLSLSSSSLVNRSFPNYCVMLQSSPGLLHRSLRTSEN
jgi:hypothetical protein